MPRKKKTKMEVRQGELDRIAFIEQGNAPQPITKTVALDKITERAGEETRQLDAAHVIALAESIAALGLIEPIVVDQETRLLAGGHRLAACRVLIDEDRAAKVSELCPGGVKDTAIEAATALPEKIEFDPSRVPVRVMGFDSAKEPALALGIEMGENEHRKDYSRADIKRLLKRLESAGYRMGRGRPKKGEKSAMPVLVSVIGKSRSQIHRILAAEGKEDIVARATISDGDLRRKRQGALIKATKAYLESKGVPKATREVGEAFLKMLLP